MADIFCCLKTWQSTSWNICLWCKGNVEMEEIPGGLVINWDQTVIYYVPESSCMIAKEGSKRVEFAEFDDNSQISALFDGTLSGDVLSPQLIYWGKTCKSLPPLTFPPDWHCHLHRKPLLKWKGYGRLHGDSFSISWEEKQELKLHVDLNYPAVVIFDRFQGQWTENILALLEAKRVSCSCSC